MDFLYNSKILSEKECNFIKDYILENEDKIKLLGPDEYGGTSNNSLTGRFKLYNFLYTPVEDIMLPKLRKIFNKLNFKYPISIQCWANIFRHNEGISKHIHANKDKFPSANVFISGPTDMGTWYEEKDKSMKKIYNEIGNFTMFWSDIYHYVPKNFTDKIRVTMAMDIHTEKRYSNLTRYYIMEK